MAGPTPRRRLRGARRGAEPRARRARSSSDGLQWRDTPREVAEAGDVVFSIACPTTPCSTAVASGPDGILAGLAAGTDLGRHEHGQPTRKPRACRARPLARGGHARRARIRQRPAGAERNADDHGRRRRARLRARRADAARARARRTHVGENGQGLVLKLAINISLAVQMLAFARACCWPNEPESTASSPST